MVKVLWTQKQDVGPMARGGHAIAFDPARQRVVLIGGRAGGGTLQADTWEWDGSDWTQVADTGPDARSGHALAFDTNRQRAVLFGGEAAGSSLRADTWEWDGSDWTQVADTGPGLSVAFAMAFAGGATLLFGGVTSPQPGAAGELSRLSWEWDGVHWTLRQNMGPAPRWGHALAFDAARGRAVLFGGFSAPPSDPNVADSVLADTWEASLEQIPPDGGVTVPSLASFSLNPHTISISMGGAAGQPVWFEVGLDGPAPPGGVQVNINSTDGTMGFAILVAEGQTTGTTVGPAFTFPTVGFYGFEARLGPLVLTDQLEVVP